MAAKTAVLVLALLAGCATVSEPVVKPIAQSEMHPGYGVVERISEVRVLPERSAAAGGSAPKENARPVYRIEVRLADGTLQYRDVDKPEFKVGDNVLLTNAGDILPD